MTSQEDRAKIDAVLDAALDELLDDSDDDEFHDAADGSTHDVCPQVEMEKDGTSRETTATEPQLQPTLPVAMGPPRPPPAFQDDVPPEKLFADMMQQMLQSELGGQNSGGPEQGEDEFLGRLMQEMQSQLQSELAQMEATASPTLPKESSKKTTTTTTSAPSSSQSQKSKRGTTLSAGKEEVEQTISNLVQGMAKQATIDKDESEKANDPEAQDEMLKSLMEGIAALGDDDGDGDHFNADAVIDGMMEQLLSKDLMYEPMKQVAFKFPDWLEQRRDTLTSDEYAERKKQCDCFQNLVRVYESEPDNVGKLMELMQEVQEYGQPPAEIIQEIAPGLELDDGEMPKFGGSGLPFSGDEECRIM